jgi:hypothetical protein
MARRMLGRLTAALLAVVAVGTSGCVWVPVPEPVVGPPVVVAPRPVVIVPGRPVYRAYRPRSYYDRGYGWHRGHGWTR